MQRAGKDCIVPLHNARELSSQIFSAMNKRFCLFGASPVSAKHFCEGFCAYT